MTTKSKNFIVICACAILLLSTSAYPIEGWAKNNGKSESKIKGASIELNSKLKIYDDDEDEDEKEAEDKKEERKNEDSKKNKERNKSCFKAFGHLIAPGWIKRHGLPETDPNCVLPSGIAKKFFRHSTTTPPTDISAPVISNITARSGANFAIVTWNTSERAKSSIFWSTSTPVNTASANVINMNIKSTFHFAILTGLEASTTYHALVNAKDTAGNTSTSSQFSFTTGGGSVVVVDTTAPIISATSTAVGSTTINVSWQTNEQATSKVYYSTTTPVNTSTANFVSNSSLVTSHSIGLTGLSTSTLYHLLIESKDSSNNTATSSQFSTTTLGS